MRGGKAGTRGGRTQTWQAVRSTRAKRWSNRAMDERTKNWRGVRTLVTGGLGFIGSNLVHRLHALGAQVMVVDALIPGHGGNRANLAGIEQDIAIIVGDLRDRVLIENLVAAQDVVFNLAGQISHEDSTRDPFT